MANEEKRTIITEKLKELRNDLADYYKLLMRIKSNDVWNQEEKKTANNLFYSIGLDAGYLGWLITDLTDESTIVIDGKPYNMWSMALRIPIDYVSWHATGFCIQVLNRALGQLVKDINSGKRDKYTGESIIKKEKNINNISKTNLKVFIAHEGETRALTILKEFLETLEIRYYIAEVKASNGRSIEKQVDWTQSKADFAICLATKGKAINKKTGRYYMGLNVAEELGRARLVFKNHIILLVQKGVEVQT